MHKKGLTKLKTAWKDVKKKGGWFALGLNGFPQERGAVPVFVVDPKEKVAKEDLRKAADEPKLDKLVFGRIAVEGAKLAFLIDAESPVQSPSLLKQAVQRLAEHDDTKDLLGRAGASAFRLASEVALDGEAEVATAAQIEAEGGKASRTARFVGSDYVKLLDALKTWEKKYQGRLDATNVDAGEKLLNDLVQRATSWLGKHAGDGAKDARRGAVEKILAAARTGLTRIADYRAAVGAHDEADEVAGSVDQGLSGSLEAQAGQLQRARDNLAHRLATTKDADEQRALASKLRRVDGGAVRNVAGRLRALPRDLDVRKDLDGENARILALGGLSRELETLAGTIGERVVRENLSPQAVTEEVKANSRDLTDALDALEQAGAKKTAHEVRRRLCAEAIDGAGVELAQQADNATDADTFLVSIGRGNSPVIDLRAKLIDGLGREHAAGLAAAARLAIGATGAESLSKYDATSRPQLVVAHEALRKTDQRLRDEVEAARAPLVKRLVARLGDLGLAPNDYNPIVQDLVAFPGMLAGAPTKPTPTVDELVVAVLQYRPELAAKLAERTATAITKHLVERTDVGDTGPGLTHAAVRDLVLSRVTAGQPIDEASVLEALPDQPHWSKPLSRKDLRERVTEAGLVDAEALRADQEAHTDAQQHHLAAITVRDVDLQRDGKAFADEGKDLFDAAANAFKAVLDPLLSRPQDLPKPILEAVAHAYDTVSQIPKAGDRGGRAIVVDLLMLRWIAPAINAGLTPPDQKAFPPSALYVTQLLQNVANRTLPNKLEALPFLELVRDTLPKFDKFLDDVLELAEAVELRDVKVSDLVTREVRDPMSGKPVIGSAHSDHPEARSGSREKRMLEQQEQRLIEALKDPTPQAIFETLFRQKARAMVQDFVRGHADEIVLLGPVPGSWLASFKDAFKLACKTEANPLVWSNGSVPAVKKTLEAVREALQDELDEARENGRSALFVAKVDDDEDEDAYDQDEHWRYVMVPRLVGQLNGHLMRPTYDAVRVTDVDAVVRDVLGPVGAEHVRIFDPKRHKDLGQRRDSERTPPELGKLLDDADTLITGAFDELLRTKQPAHGLALAG